MHSQTVMNIIVIIVLCCFDLTRTIALFYVDFLNCGYYIIVIVLYATFTLLCMQYGWEDNGR